MKQITIDAPCKINLSLDIVRRLENGYHETYRVVAVAPDKILETEKSSLILKFKNLDL